MNLLLGHSITLSTPDGTREVQIAVRPADHATEWGFVLQHSEVITRFAHRMCCDARLDPGDLQQEAIEWIVRLHGSFDPSRAAASSWIYFMVRRARQAILARLNREARELSVDPQALYGADGYAPEPSDQGHTAARMEAVALLSQVLQRSTQAEHEAFLAMDPDRPVRLPVKRTKRRPAHLLTTLSPAPAIAS